jgi:hypothetical protein
MVCMLLYKIAMRLSYMNAGTMVKLAFGATEPSKIISNERNLCGEAWLEANTCKKN